jgi:hypothetical protein
MRKGIRFCSCNAVVGIGAFLFAGGLMGIVKIASPEFPLYLGMLLMILGVLSSSLTLAPDQNEYE